MSSSPRRPLGRRAPAPLRARTGGARAGRALPRCALAMGLAAPLLASCRTGGPGSGPPQHYDDPAAMIAVFEEPERDAWQLPDRVVRALPFPSKSAVVADIGAGSGYFTRRLAAEVPDGRVYAVDVDGKFEDYLLEHREAWGTPNIQPHLAIYEDPMLPAGEIDLVFTANTYAFIRKRVGYFSKVRTALSAEGRLAIIEFRPDASPPGNIAPAPEHRIGREQAIAELEKAGFTLEREETFLPYQWFLVLKPTPKS